MSLVIEHVFFTADQLQMQLSDGRAFAVALSRIPSLMKATAADRDAWELCAAGTGIHWPSLDEDLSLNGLLRDATPLPAHAVMTTTNPTSPSL